MQRVVRNAQSPLGGEGTTTQLNWAKQKDSPNVEGCLGIRHGSETVQKRTFMYITIQSHLRPHPAAATTRYLQYIGHTPCRQLLCEAPQTRQTYTTKYAFAQLARIFVLRPLRTGLHTFIRGQDCILLRTKLGSFT